MKTRQTNILSAKNPKTLKSQVHLSLRHIRVNDKAVSLSLFGFSNSEQAKCMDAIDFLATGGRPLTVELHLKQFDEFIEHNTSFERGLSLVRVPDDLTGEEIDRLVCNLSNIKAKSSLHFIPVISMLPVCADFMARVSPHCPTLLTQDSDLYDFAAVLSAFLFGSHLRRTEKRAISSRVVDRRQTSCGSNTATATQRIRHPNNTTTRQLPSAT
jgi:hypothetical protein